MKTATRARKTNPAKAKSARSIGSSIDGPTETIAASVPSALVKEVRARVDKGEFSRFVARSIQHELVRMNRSRFVADFEEKFGALDQKAVDRARRAIRGE